MLVSSYVATKLINNTSDTVDNPSPSQADNPSPEIEDTGCTVFEEDTCCPPTFSDDSDTNLLSGDEPDLDDVCCSQYIYVCCFKTTCM